MAADNREGAGAGAGKSRMDDEFFSRAVDQIMGPIIWFDPPDPELSANHKQQKAGRRVGVNKTGPIRAAAPPEPEFVRQKQPEQEEPNHWFRLEGKIVLLFRGKPPKCLTGWVGLINPSRSLCAVGMRTSCPAKRLVYLVVTESTGRLRLI